MSNIRKALIRIQFLFFRTALTTFLQATRPKASHCGVFVFFLYSKSCTRTFKQLKGFFTEKQLEACVIFVPWWANNDIIESKVIRSFSRLFFLIITNKITKFFFVLNSLSFYRSHRYGVDFSKTLLGHYPISTIQHAISKGDSIECLSGSIADEIFVWDETAAQSLWAVGKKVKIMGNPSIAMSQLNFSAPRKNVLVAVCTHDEYKTDEEHLAFFESIFRLFKGWDGMLIFKPHPAEDHRKFFYSEFIRKFSKTYSVNACFDKEILMDSGFALIVTRASSIAENASLLGIPLLIYDLNNNGPSRVFDMCPIKDRALIIRGCLSKYNLKDIIHQAQLKANKLDSQMVLRIQEGEKLKLLLFMKNEFFFHLL